MVNIILLNYNSINYPHAYQRSATVTRMTTCERIFQCIATKFKSKEMEEMKNKKSLFKMQIEKNKEVYKVMIALNMFGINADMLNTELIMKAIESYYEMDNTLDLETASKIRLEVHDKYEKILNEYKNQ